MRIFHTYINRVYNIITRVIVCLIAMCTGTLLLSASPNNQEFLPRGDLGISGFFGKSYNSGFYRDYLTNSYSIGIGLIYPLPILLRNLYAETEFHGIRRELRESTESKLDLYTLRAGLTYSYPLFNYFQPYAGLGLQESYLKLTADKIGEEETSFKPGAAIKAGFFSSLHRDLTLRIGADYSVMPLSDKRLESISFTAAVMVRVPLSGFDDKKTSRIAETGTGDVGTKKAEELYQRGMLEKEKGDIAAAETSFREALSLKPEHENAGRMIREIGEAKADYASAREMISRKQYYEAIPLLEKSRAIIQDAERDLADTRVFLSVEIPDLEQKGIAAYEIRDYDRCISLMRRLQLIDPENETVRLYLPRAQSRKKAIDRLK